MKTLQNNFTTPEQSSRLLKLGVPADSADMKYWEGHRITEDDIPLLLVPGVPYSKSNMEFNNLPCWSVGRLIEIYATCTDCSLFELPLEDSLIDTLIDGIEWNRLDFSKLEE